MLRNIFLFISCFFVFTPNSFSGKYLDLSGLSIVDDKIGKALRGVKTVGQMIVPCLASEGNQDTEVLSFSKKINHGRRCSSS